MSRQVTGKAMLKKSFKKTSMETYGSAWIITGAVVILMITVMILAVLNIQRERHYMADILSEKGSALIKSFEIAARTGMMTMMWERSQVQTLLEETARQPGILYFFITDKKGLILAHSDRNQIGKEFFDTSPFKESIPETSVEWRLRNLASGQRAFEVVRYFRPFAGVSRTEMEKFHMPMYESGILKSKADKWCFDHDRSFCEKKIIFLGLDISPFESAQKEDIKNTLVISAILAVLGFGGLFSIFLTQRYRATRRLLQDTSAFADEVVTKLPVGLIATDRADRITFFNEAAEAITGLSYKDVRDQSLKSVLPCGLYETIDHLMEGEHILEQEMECDFPVRAAVPVSVTASRIINEEGNFIGNILMLRDLGEVRKLQNEIRRKEKLAALGGLAAGVAHEIRNPLSSIKGLASLFKNKFVDNKDDREAAEVMIREVDRLNRVISELLEFARPSNLNFKPTNINYVLDHSVRLIQEDAKTKDIKILLSKENNLPTLFIDPDRFVQCLLNLYLNGIQAMENGGNLSIRAFLGKMQDVRIEIADTGTGIAAEYMDKIFDPYFTTKTSGTGLGLAIVQKIIEAHEGRITVRSAPGEGTGITVSIPIKTQEKIGKDIE